jgi:hypothetical protein
MAKVEEIKILNIDNVPYAVDAMSKEVQELVAAYNEMLVREAEVKSWYTIVQAAKAQLSQQIIGQVRADKEAAEKAAAEKDNSDVEAIEEAPADNTLGKELPN